MKVYHHSFRKERINVHIKKYKINNEYTAPRCSGLTGVIVVLAQTL